MKKFLKQLELEANKHFDQEETLEVVNYYEEIINDRLASGEDLLDIINNYDIKKIIKEMMPEIISKRKLANHRDTSKSLWQLTLILFSAPVLIPLAVAFIAIVIALGIVLLSGGIVIGAAILTVIPYFVEVINFSSNIGVIFGLSGIGLLTIAILLVVGIILIKVSYLTSKYLVKGFSKIIIRKQAK